ncbi:MAG: hypothetical protein QM770_23510 [Tepidisphaeraceae bacterium]
MPVLRMLGQDPVYYYENQFPLPEGRVIHEPDTMEPVWTSGRSRPFIDAFLDMIERAPTGAFAYAQLGQENNFGWESMREAYPVQMDALVRLREAGTVRIETMGETGRRFKTAFDSTPVQCQIMPADPFGNTSPAHRTIWYQSRFYRANLHFRGDLPYLRDLTIYDDAFPQPFLEHATRDHEVPQRLLAVLDGYHWKADEKASVLSGIDDATLPRAGGFFLVDGKPLRLSGEPGIRNPDESTDTLDVDLPVGDRRTLRIRFEPERITVRLVAGDASLPCQLAFGWNPMRSAFTGVDGDRAKYRWENFDYELILKNASLEATPTGWQTRASANPIELLFHSSVPRSTTDATLK